MSLAAHARELDVALSGSILAVAPADRASAAGRLAREGHWVHADVIEGSFRGQPGLGIADLAGLDGVSEVLDVHLMVDDPAAAIRALPLSPRRLTVQLRRLGDAGGVLALARAAAKEAWIAVEELPGEHTETLRRLDPDGVIVMLTPPGTPGRSADLARLASVRRIGAAGFGSGVDGGVTAHNIRDVAAAGAGYAVSGRGLLDDQEGKHAYAVTDAD